MGVQSPRKWSLGDIPVARCSDTTTEPLRGSMVGRVHLPITGLSVSDTEPGVYHDCSPSRTAHMCRISDTAHVPWFYPHIHSMPHRISDTMLMPVRYTSSLRRLHQRVSTRHMFPPRFTLLAPSCLRHSTYSQVLYSIPTALLYGVTLPHQRVGDTQMRRSL